MDGPSGKPNIERFEPKDLGEHLKHLQTTEKDPHFVTVLFGGG